MKRIFHCAVAVLCAVGSVTFVVLSVTQSLFNVIFAVTGGFLTLWHLQLADVKFRYNKPVKVGVKQQSDVIVERMMAAIIAKEHDAAQRRYKEIMLFREEHREIISKMQMEYRQYVNEAFQKERDIMLSYHIATERMMLKYGDDVYTAFRDSRSWMFCCLSPSMSVANLEAARQVLSRIVS